MLHSDFLFKVVLIGDSGVGKSCLLVRFADDTFQESFITTIGVDFRFRTLPVDESSVKLQIVSAIQWDTAGQERFRTITTAYYRSADGILLVYDKNNRESFEHIDSWMEEVNRCSAESAVKLLVGNKADLAREVSTEEGAAKARSYGLQFIETSAKAAFQVDAAFLAMARELLVKRKETGHSAVSSASSRLAPAEPKKEAGCCN